MKIKSFLPLRFCMMLLSLVAVLSSNAQAFTVTGTVTDETNEPLIGATVVVKGNASIGVATNYDGQFTLTVPSPETELAISYIGYLPVTVKINGKKEIKVKMEPDTSSLDEVVVVGYGTQKKITMTGSVSAVSSKELLTAPMTNVSNLLVGKATGVTAIQTSGIPGGDNASILVRGINGFGGRSPLVIVDGVERYMDYLNPNDIESISVLKDAAAAIYGIKGSNGVIVITTKQGQGKTQINYSTSLTAVKNTAFPEFLNASEYMYYRNKARMMDGLDPIYTAEIQQKVLENDPDSYWGETDWFGQIFRTGFTQQHNLSASGSTERVKYFTSIGYMDQDGTVKHTDYQRYNLRANLDIMLAQNLNFKVNISGIKTSRYWPSSSFAKQSEINPIRQAGRAAPVIKPYWNGYTLGWKEEGEINVNPIAALENGYQKQNKYIFNSSWDLEYELSHLWKPLTGLKIGAFFSYDYSQTTDRNYDKPYELLAFDNNSLEYNLEPAYAVGVDGAFTRSSSGGESWVFRPSVSYFNKFGKNSVGALLFLESSRKYDETMTMPMRGYYADDPVDVSLGSSVVNNQYGKPSGSHKHTGMRSYAGRFNYDYDNKYLVEFAFRYDGSYIFAPENRWGFFPSISAGWVLSRENFLKNVQWLDMLKLRGSFGETGDDSVSPFMYLKTYSIANYSYMLGSEFISQFYTNSYVFKDVTWARTKTWNLGIEGSVLNNKLNAEIDLFYKRCSGILEGTSSSYPPSLAGYYPPSGNTGETMNRGFEIALTHTLAPTKDFSYRIRGMFSFARNKVLKMKRSDSYANYREQVGYPVGARFGYRCIGFYESMEDIDNYCASPSGTELLPGDLKYLDYNGDGILSKDKDWVRIGYGQTPEINFSMAMDFNYRDFYLRMVWQGVTHCDYSLQGVYDNGHSDGTVYTKSLVAGNCPKYIVEGAWTPDNPNPTFPRLSSDHRYHNYNASDFWVINGEYLRLKNIQLGYNVPRHVLTRTPFSDINVYLAGSNVVTFSHFKYIDPESPSISNGFYPQQATYSFGLNVSF